MGCDTFIAMQEYRQQDIRADDVENLVRAGGRRWIRKLHTPTRTGISNRFRVAGIYATTKYNISDII